MAITAGFIKCQSQLSAVRPLRVHAHNVTKQAPVDHLPWGPVLLSDWSAAEAAQQPDWLQTTNSCR